MTITSSPSVILGKISAFFFPLVGRPIGNMADLRASKAPVQIRPKPISTRSVKQQPGDDGARLEKKASRPVPWATRFQLLVFAVRLRFSSGGPSANALRADIKAFKKALGKTDMPDVVRKLDAMLAETIEKYTLPNPERKIPLAMGPTYTGL